MCTVTRKFSLLIKRTNLPGSRNPFLAPISSPASRKTTSRNRPRSWIISTSLFRPVISIPLSVRGTKKIDFSSSKFAGDKTYIYNFLVSNSKKPGSIETAPSRPTSFTLPVRTRQNKKPSATSSRPFDKLPQQHAPNTRAPGYTGPLLKSRPNRAPSNRPPYRRESHIEDHTETVNSTILNR